MLDINISYKINTHKRHGFMKVSGCISLIIV